MNEQQKLTISMAIFFLIVFVSLGTIVVTEKASSYMGPKIEKKINSYIDTNYVNIKKNITTSQVSYFDKQFKMKVTSKKNKNHYFYIYYQNKTITDTYQEDYIEGKNLLNHVTKKISNDINKKTNKNYKISINSNLNDFTETVQNKIISEDNLTNLRIYTLEENIYLTNWTVEEISKEIVNLINNLERNNITPKYYKITFTDKKDIAKSLEISNIMYTITTDPNLSLIITDILNDNYTKLIKDNEITYKYLN